MPATNKADGTEMTTPGRSTPAWLHPPPAPRQYAVLISTAPDDPAARIAVDYALLREDSALLPAHPDDDPEFIAGRAQARLLFDPAALPPADPDRPLVSDRGLQTELHFPASGHTRALDLPVFVRASDAGPEVSYHPKMVEPANPAELAQLITLSTGRDAPEDLERALELADAILDEIAAAKPVPVGLTREDMDLVRRSARPRPGEAVPGDRGGTRVFRITFADGCCYLGHTGGNILNRVAGICGLPDYYGRPTVPHARAAAHAGAMEHEVECLSSELGDDQARDLKRRLLHSPPPGHASDGTAFIHSPGCVLTR